MNEKPEEPGPRKIDGPRRWKPAKVTLQGHTYLLHPDGKAYHVASSKGTKARQGPLRRVKDHELVKAIKAKFMRLSQTKEQEEVAQAARLKALNSRPRPEEPSP